MQILQHANLFFPLTGLHTLGFAYRPLTNTHNHSKWFVFLYCMSNFFQNFGPNTTTFIIPGEAFPTRYRSTAHGISAASGKLGAIVAQVGFARLRNIGGTNRFLGHMYGFLFCASGKLHLILTYQKAFKYSPSSCSPGSLLPSYSLRPREGLWKNCLARTRRDSSGVCLLPSFLCGPPTCTNRCPRTARQQGGCSRGGGIRLCRASSTCVYVISNAEAPDFIFPSLHACHDTCRSQVYL